MIEAGHQCPLAILLQAITREGDDDNRPCDFLPEPGGDLIAVHAGQADIEQDRVRSLALGELDGQIPVTSDPDLVSEVT